MAVAPLRALLAVALVLVVALVLLEYHEEEEAPLLLNAPAAADPSQANASGGQPGQGQLQTEAAAVAPTQAPAASQASQTYAAHVWPLTPQPLPQERVSYANSPKAERLACFDRLKVVEQPWHWEEFSYNGRVDLLLAPDPGPSWRVAFDAAASYQLPPRTELGSAIFARLHPQLDEVVPAEPAREAFQNGAPKSATDTLQALMMTLLRLRCLAEGDEQCQMHPAVPGEASLGWLFVHGCNTYFEDVQTGRLLLVMMEEYPFNDTHGAPSDFRIPFKHWNPTVVESIFPAPLPGLGVGRRVFLNIVRAPLPRTVSWQFHRAHFNDITHEEIIKSIQKRKSLPLLPYDMAKVYSREDTPLELRRRIYYMQTEVLLNADYKPHILSDMARFMLGDGADAEVVRRAVGVLAKFEAPRMDHGIAHPPFTKVITEANLRRTAAQELPDIVRAMYPFPKTMAGPFEVRLCNINAYLWELEDKIECEPFGTYA